MIPLRDQLPTRIVPFVNYGLIAANIAVFVWQSLQIESGIDAERLTRELGLVPDRFLVDPGAAVVTIFTSMFMHGGLGHIAGNMLFLWIFGDNVEDALGHGRYLIFYLLGGVFAAGAQTAVALSNPEAAHMPMVGASGAISAVLAAYALLYPMSPITVLNPFSILLWFVFGPFLQFPAWLVIAAFFLVNLWSALTSSSTGGVAFMAHVGGFLAGAILLRVFMAGRARVDDYDRWHRLERRGRRDAW